MEMRTSAVSLSKNRVENMNEEASQTPTNTNRNLPPETREGIRWWLLLLNCATLATGTIGGPLISRLYFLHGGSRKWVPSWLQTVGFPILLIPLSILYFQNRAQERPAKFFAGSKLLIASAVIGLLVGLNSYMYSVGLSYLPVSTTSILFATQLAFTAIFALIIVRQKFTAYSINSVVLMTLGSIILGIHKSGDRPPNVSDGQYLLGFFITLGAAVLLGFILPSIELAYAKCTKAITYNVVMQFQLGVMLFATIFCTIGMLINNDFKAIQREAKEYGLGETKYYVVLVSCAVLFQMLFIGTLGVVFCVSSLFTGILSAALLPLTEVAGVIAFDEKFTAEKGMALALCLWGFTSYFYGAYVMNKNQKPPVTESEANNV
ncbi:purine permease 1-like [Magnolia sinica]|uniref:purine permease 1-like n=1 Tax=Magnolia sinica TaxID=86752 RepID=UPI002659D8B4|nr:purine permease 1-like [Magnolia sinica]